VKFSFGGAALPLNYNWSNRVKILGTLTNVTLSIKCIYNTYILYIIYLYRHIDMLRLDRNIFRGILKFKICILYLIVLMYLS